MMARYHIVIIMQHDALE